VLATGAEQRPLLPLTASPLAAGDAAGKFDAHQTDNVLAAVAAAWALGLSDDLMRAGIAGFEARLRERFPEIALLQPAGHDEAVSMAHALEFATLGLQAQAGCPVTFSRSAQTLEAGVFQVVVEYSEEEVGRLALELAEQLCQAAAADTPFDLADALLKGIVRYFSQNPPLARTRQM